MDEAPIDPDLDADAEAGSEEPATGGPAVSLTQRGWRRWAGGHPWIFRDDLAEIRAESGDLAAVFDARGREVGAGLVSGTSKIALRTLTRMPGVVDERALIRERLDEAARRRPKREAGEAERVVAAEADGLPGLIVDRFADVLCVQHAVPYWERRRGLVTEVLRERFAPRAIVARDDFSARSLEGLPRHCEVLHGEEPGPVAIREGAVTFEVDPVRGQKTGFFLDQRANRERVASLARGRVLDVFTGDGGFALHAAKAGAEHVLGIDSSEPALQRAKANAERNGVAARIEWGKAMAFDDLRDRSKQGQHFDLVVLDPPAFAKNRRELDAALRGYVEINSRAMRLVEPGGHLATFSCSYHLTEEFFARMLQESASDCGRRVYLVDRLRQSPDHPIVLTHPESLYLKGAILRVE